MADLVPAVGTISYNGVAFGPKTETLEFLANPQYDVAGRAVVYVEYKIRLRSILNTTPPVDTDATLDALHQALLQPGGELRYQDKGVGDFALNVGGPRDVMWGPKPTLFGWKPLGSSYACEI